MNKKINNKKITPPQEEDLFTFEQIDNNQSDTTQTVEAEINPPKITDVGWHDYVMSQFEPHELKDGNPTANGLRRVTELLLGPIVEGRAHVVQCPSDNNGWLAVVQYTIRIDLSQLGSDNYLLFSDVGDVWEQNTDANFLRYPIATASTRAEARAYRKALKLNKIAAEEIPDHQPVSNVPLINFIKESQIKRIELDCARADIDMTKFIQSGLTKYKNIKSVPYDEALKMINALNGYLNKKDSVPEEIKI